MLCGDGGSEWLTAPLTPAEEAATQALLDVVNPWRASRGYEPLAWAAGCCFQVL